MANKKVKYTYSGATQDLSKSKHPFQYYYEAGHIRLISTDTQSTSSIINEKGTEIVISLPQVSINPTLNIITYDGKILNYSNGGEIDTQISNNLISNNSGEHNILNITNTRTGIVIFSTDNNGFDCIWEVKNLISSDYTLELLYVRNLGFSTNNPIQSIFNYENDKIQKVYWIDGNHQIRFINISHNLIEGNDLLIDLPSTTINFVSNVEFSQPTVIDTLSGGGHTAGMIQYTYNLFRKNSSQTKIAPLSQLISLDKGSNKGGGDVNEVVSETPVIEIDNIDLSYTNIKVYAIKYTSLDQTPSVSLIEERELDSNKITIYDDGSVIDTLTLEELVFLGSDPIIPQHIHSKDNRLFPVNITTKPFILPDEMDMRAYSFEANNTVTLVIDDYGPQQSSSAVSSLNNFINPIKNDSINANYNLYKYQPNSTTLGGEGKYLKFEIVQKNLSNIDNLRVFKDEEIYRLGIEFYNTLGQTSLPKWFSDYKMPIGNLDGNYNTLNVSLKPEFYTWLNNYNFDDESKPIGYRIIRAKREERDKTILSQGIASSMVFQVTDVNKASNLGDNVSLIREYQDSKLKVPTPLIRTNTNQGTLGNSIILAKNKHLGYISEAGATSNDSSAEIRGVDLAESFQHTKMIQIYSPEILFDITPNFTNDLNIKVKGAVVNTVNGVYAQERIIDTKQVRYSGKTLGGLNPRAINSNEYIEDNDFVKIFEYPEIISVSFRDDSMNFQQYYRKFDNITYSNNSNQYPIHGIPEITDKGAESKFYNNDPRYNYSNSLESVITGRDFSARNIKYVNNFGAESIVVVLGDPANDTYNKKGLDNLELETGLGSNNSALILEIVKSGNSIYTSNIYGGNSYEDKKRTSYISIGNYSTIDTTSVQIDNPGDTFVQNFKFLRIGKTDTEVYDNESVQLSEIVEVKVETTVDIKNRNDISLSQWDTRFQPRFDEYHQYNTVYSQESTLVENTDIDTTRLIESFDTRIQTTKLKIPNETIDSWTDTLVNETMELDGKFGPINNIIEYNDNLFTFQDEAIASISINPRVQIQASDNVGIELGTGSILYDYNYITTKSGSINKWGIVSTKKGIYYYDALNKGIGRVPDATKVLLSDIKGMHTFFNNNYNYNLIKEDNPLLKQGVLFGFDNYNNDVYFTIHQDEQSFTWCFNEIRDEFIDLKQYIPIIYNSKGDKLISVSNSTSSLIHEHGIGEYNNFYGNYHPSYIILQVNPESDLDTVINTIHYNSELYLDDIDQPDKTLTHIQAYNEYQDTGRIPLIIGRDSNLRRKFREWRASVPRDGRSRIRNPWIFLKLELDNTSNYKFILHDIIINYSI